MSCLFRSGFLDGRVGFLVLGERYFWSREWDIIFEEGRVSFFVKGRQSSKKTKNARDPNLGITSAVAQ